MKIIKKYKELLTKTLESVLKKDVEELYEAMNKKMDKEVAFASKYSAQMDEARW